MNKKIILDVLWVVGILSGIVLCLWGINVPYVGIYNANNNYLALASKNFLRFGYGALHFLPTYYVGSALPSAVPYYLHHPVVFFLIASLPFRWFGSDTWVVHAATLGFLFASIWMLYLVVCEIWSQEVARWTAVCATVITLTSFFWKYMFFEQSSLFFTLATVFFCIRYWKTPKRTYLIGVAVASFFGGATDWYGGYLMFGFVYLLWTRSGTRVWTVFRTYIAGELLGLGTYVAALVLTGNLGAFWEGFSARGLTSELTSLSYWPVRLGIVTLIRLLIYVSPLIIFALWRWMRDIQTVPAPARRIGMIFLIIGIINIAVLPSATWGHSYFLFYLMPFVALTMGAWIAGLTKKSAGVVCLVVLFQLGWSTGVGALKLSQVTKQTWKYDFGRDASRKIPRYSRVGVLEYPGDVLQNYFFIDALPMSQESIRTWQKTGLPADIRQILVTCKGTCTPEERLFIRKETAVLGVTAYHYGQNSGWVLDRGEPGEAQMSLDEPSAKGENPIVAPSGLLRIYRQVRDFLGSTQI